MIILALVLLGLCLGSFVNALVWRIHEQSKKSPVASRQSKKKLKTGDRRLETTRFSILKGRSMCPNCKHSLSASDLIPVFSWLMLRGKCRYCSKAISWQYPVVELSTAVLFVASYIFWPTGESPVSSLQSSVNFIVWLAMLVGFMALIIYDIRWMLLPNRIIYPLIVLALGLSVFNIVFGSEADILIKTLLSVMIAGGLFYLLFVVSSGRWIGGGDVKLGLLSGLLLADPYLAFLMLLMASCLGTVFILPAMFMGKIHSHSRIPFGPFLIIATIVVKLFGAAIVEWYKRSLLLQV